MKKFKTKSKNGIDTLIIIVIVLTSILMVYYNKTISKSILDVGMVKLEEITNMYVKKNIVPKGEAINDLIQVNKNNKDEILYVDIDTEKANIIMLDVVTKIQNNINEIDISDELLKKYKDNIYLEVPITFESGVLFANLGPKVPIKLSFYEQVLASIETEITNYGINNALLKIYLIVDLEQKIYVPFKDNKFNRSYKLLLSAKMINGTVPSFLGGSITKTETLKTS